MLMQTDFEKHIERLEKIVTNDAESATAIRAARNFGSAVDALLEKFTPEEDFARDLYYALVKEYLTEQMEDIEVYV